MMTLGYYIHLNYLTYYINYLSCILSSVVHIEETLQIRNKIFSFLSVLNFYSIKGCCYPIVKTVLDSFLFLLSTEMCFFIINAKCIKEYLTMDCMLMK